MSLCLSIDVRLSVCLSVCQPVRQCVTWSTDTLASLVLLVDNTAGPRGTHGVDLDAVEQVAVTLPVGR